MEILIATTEERAMIMAFHAVLKEVKNLSANETADAGKYSYSYAGLPDVLEEIKRALATQDFTVSQALSMTDGCLSVTTTLLHATGSGITFAPMMIAAPKEPQQLGSASTYLRRYSLLAIFGLAVEDDDGAAAAHHPQPEQPVRQAPPSTRGSYRTKEEATMRAILNGKPAAEVREIQQAFKAEFECSLSDLPRERHEEALRWFKWIVGGGPAEIGQDVGQDYPA